MSEKLEQLNLRVPSEVKRGMKAAAAAAGLTMEELGLEVIRFYCNEVNDEIFRRREVASPIIQQLAGKRWCAMEGSNLRPPPCQRVVDLPNSNSMGKTILQIADLEGYELPAPQNVLPLRAEQKYPLSELPIAA